MAEGRDNVMQRWEVTNEKWASLPKWSPSNTNPPPLSIAKAVELGEQWVRKSHSDIRNLVVSQVTLRGPSQSGPGIDEKWFYRLEFQPIVAGKKAWGAEVVAVVLFDGTVVSPKPEAYTPPSR